MMKQSTKSFEALQALLLKYNVEGEIENRPNGAYLFRASNGGTLTYWPHKGSLYVKDSKAMDSIIESEYGPSMDSHDGISTWKVH